MPAIRHFFSPDDPCSHSFDALFTSPRILYTDDPCSRSLNALHTSLRQHTDDPCSSSWNAMHTSLRHYYKLKRFQPTVHSYRTAPREAPDSRPQPKADETYRKPCFRCGGEHTTSTCRYRGATCRYCNKRGHIKDNCFKLKRDQAAYDAPDNESTSSDTTTRNEVKQIQHEVPRDFDDWTDDEYIQMVRTDAETGSNQTFNDENMWYTATVNGVAVNFVIDTGSRVTTMPHQSFKQAFPHAPLYPADKRLRTITDEVIHTTGMSHVNVNKAKKRLLLYVTQNGAAPLLGRDWLRALDFDIADMANFNNFPDTLIRQTGDATSGASKK